MAFTRNEVYDKIAKLLAEQLNIATDRIQEESTLESLGVDSLDRFEIIMKIEEEFSITINDQDAENISTVKQAVDYVYNLVKE